MSFLGPAFDAEWYAELGNDLGRRARHYADNPEAAQGYMASASIAFESGGPQGRRSYRGGEVSTITYDAGIEQEPVKPLVRRRRRAVGPPVISQRTAMQIQRATYYEFCRLARSPQDDQHEHVLGSSWQPMTPREMYAVLNGATVIARPSILRRTDERVALVYPGMTHSFSGEPESGKTMAALAACAEEIDAGHDVLYLDFESDFGTIGGRLGQMVQQPERIPYLFHYARPHERLEAEWLASTLERYRPTLAVIDGTTEVMVLHGFEIKENTDAAEFDGLLAKRLARAGAAVILIDHVTKSKDGRGRYSIGAQHKLAAISGAAYIFEGVREMAPGKRGAAKIKLAKDRPGGVRAMAGDDVGELVVDGTAGLSVTVEPGRAPSAWERIERWLTTYGPQTISGLGDRAAAEGSPLKADTIEKALKRNRCTRGRDGKWELPSPTA